MGSLSTNPRHAHCLNSLRIDRQSMVPMYAQISQGFIELIRTEQLCVGQAMPTNRQIVEVLDVDYKTVQRAMTNLAEQKIVARYRGKGTFVEQLPPTSGVIGVGLCGFADAFGPEASPRIRGTLYHLQSQLEQEGRQHRLYFCSDEEHSANAAFQDLMDDLQRHRLSGLLLQSSRQYMESAFQLAEQRHVPVVTLGSHDRGRINLSSHADWTKFIDQATTDMVGSGCRRIGVIYNINSDLLPDRPSMAKAIEQAGGVSGESWMVGRPCTADDGGDAMAQLAHAGLDGVIVTDDHMARGAQIWARDHQVAVPGDVILAAAWSPISGIRFTEPVVRYEIDEPEMVRKAIRLLTEANLGRRITHRHLLTPPTRIDPMPTSDQEDQPTATTVKTLCDSPVMPAKAGAQAAI